MMEIIPAIDIIGGKCVRLTQGDYDRKKEYDEQPLEVARRFADAGIRRLHLVDLDGAREGRVRNWKTLEAIAGKTALAIDFGGGIARDEDLAIVFGSGAELATIGSLAVKNEALFASWIERYGAEKFFLGADVRGKKIAVSGWTETTSVTLEDFLAKYAACGLRQYFCTDISRDGLMQGPSVELYRELVAAFPALSLTASGGVRSMADLESLAAIGCRGAILGKAIYEGSVTVKELAAWNSRAAQS